MPHCDVDAIAAKLNYMGRLARNMPPSWDGAKITIPVVSRDGEAYIAKALPGRGLLMDCDLKSVGIKRSIPYVFEKTPVMRLRDALRSERWAIGAAAGLALAAAFPRYLLSALPIFGALSTYDSILAARANGGANDVTITKLSLTTTANVWHSLYNTGGFPAAGTYSASPGSALTAASTGALSFGLPNTSGSANAYLLTFGYTSAQTLDMSILVDLLVQVGSIAINNTAFTVSSAALTRYNGTVTGYPNGAGVMMTFEVTTALVATNAGNIVVAYTNQAGSGSNTSSIALTVSAIVGRLMPAAIGPYIQLASGDYGVRAVSTVTSSSANTTTGVVALNLYFPLAFVPGVAQNVYMERDSTIQIDGLTQIQAASNVLGCLALYVLPSTTSTGILTAFMRTVQG